MRGFLVASDDSCCGLSGLGTMLNAQVIKALPWQQLSSGQYVTVTQAATTRMSQLEATILSAHDNIVTDDDQKPQQPQRTHHTLIEQ